MSQPANVTPDLDRRFTAQDVRPRALGHLNLDLLEPYQRVLMAGDGLTTTTLEAWWNEPVRVRCVHRRRRTHHADSRTFWLDVTREDEITLRRVIIMGARTGNPLARAETLYVPGRLPTYWCDLIDGIGVGPALAELQVETRRELLWYGRPPGAVAGRTYRIFIKKQPTFIVTEEFVQ